MEVWLSCASLMESTVFTDWNDSKTDCSLPVAVTVISSRSPVRRI
jgi:hypothetical protein